MKACVCEQETETEGKSLRTIFQLHKEVQNDKDYLRVTNKEEKIIGKVGHFEDYKLDTLGYPFGQGLRR